MIKIGDFARLGQVSVTTLRHYDDVGLLKPDSVDGFSGYRYYSVAQLAQLNRIMALKELGFSLSQIEQVLNGLTLEQLRGMLTLKQAEAEQQIAAERERLIRIAARLKQMEEEERMPDHDVILKQVPAALVASRRVTIPTNDQVPAILGPAFDETYAYVGAQGAKDVAPCLAIWHQPAAVLANEVAEAVVPIDKAVPGSERVAVYDLPPATVASVVHQGSFANFNKAHASLLSWIEENGYRSAGTYREVYIKHDPNVPDSSTTEIQYPVEKQSGR